MKTLSLFSHPHVFPDLYDYVFLQWNIKGEIVENILATLLIYLKSIPKKAT